MNGPDDKVALNAGISLARTIEDPTLEEFRLQLDRDRCAFDNRLG